MIQITVKYYNILSIYTGTRKTQISLPDNTNLLQLIYHLAENNPMAFREVVLKEDKPSPYLKIFLNGDMINEETLNTELKDGDEAMLFPAISGG